MKNQYCFNSLCIVCASIVPLLVTGPFLPDLLVSSSALWFLFYSFKHKQYQIYHNKYFYLFAAFCLICIISSLLSKDIFLSFQSSLFYFRIGIFALLISFLIDQNKKILDYFYYVFIVTFFALIVDGYIQYFTGFNILGFPIQGIRVSSFFREELILGSYLVRLLPLFLALFIVRKNKSSFEIYSFFIFFILLYVLIFMSGERTSFFFLNLFIVFNLLFISNYRILRLLVFIISICSVVLLVVNDSNYYDRYVDQPIKSFGMDNISKEKKIFSPEHDSLYRTALNMFLDKPLLGHGPKLFRLKCSNPKYATGNKPCDTHPHNFYIQLLAETGIIGFLFLIGILIYLSYLMIKNTWNNFLNKQALLTNYQICLLSGLLITLWPLSPNGSFFNNYLMIVYSLQIGFFRR